MRNQKAQCLSFVRVQNVLRYSCISTTEKDFSDEDKRNIEIINDDINKAISCEGDAGRCIPCRMLLTHRHIHEIHSSRMIMERTINVIEDFPSLGRHRT